MKVEIAMRAIVEINDDPVALANLNGEKGLITDSFYDLYHVIGCRGDYKNIQVTILPATGEAK